MLKVKSAIILGLFALVVTGCATIMKGSQQEMNVKSTPSDATIVVQTTGGVTVFEGKTPSTFKLNKDKEYNVVISLAGYKEQKVYVGQGSIEGAFWGNICIGGVIGGLIDFATGAWKKLEPNVINVTLATASLDGKPEALYAVFTARDQEGELRQMVVPMIPN